MKSSRAVLGIIFITVFVDLVGFGIIIPLSPFLATRFGATAFEVGLLMSVYSLMQFIFSPFWGSVSDRVGRRPIILLSLLGAGLAHLWFGLAGSLASLFLARAVAGVFGANISTAMAVIADVTPKESRAKGMGLIGAAFGLGFMLGPFIGSVVEGRFGPQSSAFAAAAICLTNLLAATIFLPESLPRKNRKTQIQRFSERHSEKFRGVFKHLRVPILGRLIFIYFLATLAMAHMEASLFLLVKDRFGWGLELAGFGFAYVGLIMVITQGFLVRRFARKLGEPRMLVGGLALGSLGLGLIAIAESVPLMAVAVTSLAFGTGFSSPALTTSVSLLGEKTEQGSLMGVNQSLASLARVLGPALGGFLYQSMSWSAPFWVASFLYALSVILALQIYQNLPTGSR